MFGDQGFLQVEKAGEWSIDKLSAFQLQQVSAVVGLELFRKSVMCRIKSGLPKGVQELTQLGQTMWKLSIEDTPK